MKGKRGGKDERKEETKTNGDEEGKGEEEMKSQLMISPSYFPTSSTYNTL